MNTNPKKSRRATLLVLVLILALVPICILLLLDRPGRLFPETSGRHGFSLQTSDGSLPTAVPSPTNIDHDADVPLAISDASAAPKEEANPSDARYSTVLSPALAGIVFASGAPSTAFGVVDLERLIAFHQSEGDSQEVKERVLQSIRRTVAARATAHGFAFVFDTSAKSSRGAPFILFTDGVPDITEEVLQEVAAR